VSWDISLLLYYKFTAESVLKDFETIQRLAKLWREVDCLNRSVHRGIVMLKDELTCNSITLQLIHLTSLESIIDKYHTGVMSTTYG